MGFGFGGILRADILAVRILVEFLSVICYLNFGLSSRAVQGDLPTTWRPTFYNLTHLVTEYVLTCGSTYDLCNPEIFSIKIDKSYISNCSPSLNCNKNCATSQTCRPDADNAFLNVACLPTNIHTIEKGDTQRYNMVSTCSNSTATFQEIMNLCHDVGVINGSNFFMEAFIPVLSRRSNIVYRNKFCAACNNDGKHTISFKMDMNCDKYLDINSFSSVREMWSAITTNNCSVSYVPPPDSYATRCLPSAYISHCNHSGFWTNYDPLIEWACENFNSGPYKGYKNVYCYICNPSVVSTVGRSVIDSCNVTGGWIQWEWAVERGCLELPFASRTWPFKNIFCKICNGFSSGYRKFENLSLFVKDTKAGFSAYFNMPVPSQTTGLHNRSETNVSSKSFTDQNVTFESLDELGKFCGHENFCSEPYKPTEVGPMCQFNCKRGGNCCIQLASGYNPETLSPFDHCDTSRSLDSLTSQCENGSGNDVLYSLPVKSEATQLVYKNLYCARCNYDYGELRPFDFTIDCPIYIEASSFIKFNDLQEVVNRYGCNVTIQTPVQSGCVGGLSSCIRRCKNRQHWNQHNRAVLEHCEKEDFINLNFRPISFNGSLYKNIFCLICNRDWVVMEENVISECNATGLWQDYDSVVEEKCQNQTMYSGWFPFKNVFCALCNQQSETQNQEMTIRIAMKIDFHTCSGFSCILKNAPYRILFSLSDVDFNGGNTDIHSDEFCAEGRLLQDGICKAIAEDTVNLGYNITFDLRIKNAWYSNLTDLRVHELVEEVFKHDLVSLTRIEVLQLKFHPVDYERQNLSSGDTSYVQYLKKYMVQIDSDNDNDVLNHTVSERDEPDFEEKRLHVNAVVFIKETNNRTEVEEALLRMRHTSLNVPIQGDFYILETYPCLHEAECDTFTPRDKTNHLALSNVSFLDIDKTIEYEFLRFNNTGLFDMGITFRTVNEMLLCVLKEIDNRDSIIRTLCLNRITFQVSPDRKKIRLCLSDWFGLQLEDASENTDVFHLAYGIFSIVCTLLSMFCLLLSFITYMLFKSLRSLPAINNMNLVFNLFWAQLFLQFGIWQTSDQNVCMFIGIVTHYFWLASFSSMNVCSYHMFKVFYKPLQVSGYVDISTVKYYCAYIYGAPVTVISAFVLTISTVSNFRETGYGGNICFLSDHLYILITFVTPASVIVLSNTVFFGIAYWHIYSSPRMQGTVERNDLKIYLKLSTVTGIAWCFLFIDTLNSLSVFSFVAAVTGALQGVYIFLAFICNWKVWTLYKTRFQGRKVTYQPPYKQSESGNTTQLTNVSSQWIRKQLDNSKETFI